nr:MAG TPA: hypothetical protein [Caudoviricetes sp.]
MYYNRNLNITQAEIRDKPKFLSIDAINKTS